MEQRWVEPKLFVFRVWIRHIGCYIGNKAMIHLGDGTTPLCQGPFHENYNRLNGLTIRSLDSLCPRCSEWLSFKSLEHFWPGNKK